MKEMIKKYKGTLICSVLVMLAGILVGFTMAQSIWINVFFVVTDCILVTIIFYDNRNRQQSSKVIGMVIWIIPVTTLIYNGMARLISMDADSENLFMAVTYFGTGLLFMIIGNYLPKVKQNNTIGIRVVWTLQDEENWSATHRFSGKLWVASGVLCMLCGLFGESIAALVLYIVSIMAAAIVSILYSYLFYKKKMAAGEKLKIQYNKKTIVIYVIVSVFVIIFTIWTLFWGSIDISFHDNDFTVEAQGWSDYTVDYEQIDSISYKENLFQNENDRRTNGMGNLKYGMGNFRNDIYGDYIRYTHASCHSYVVMDIGGKILVVNGAAHCKLLQRPAKVLFAGKHACHAIEGLANPDLLIRGDRLFGCFCSVLRSNPNGERRGAAAHGEEVRRQAASATPPVLFCHRLISFLLKSDRNGERRLFKRATAFPDE